jgi:hypothetical protein
MRTLTTLLKTALPTTLTTCLGLGLAACAMAPGGADADPEAGHLPPPLQAHSVVDLPAPGSVGTAVEGYAAYDASIDTIEVNDPVGILRPGPQAFQDYLAQFGIEANTYPSKQTGFHPRGQALDVFIAGDAGKQAFADWLTANGNEMANRLGLNQIIWQYSMWRSYSAGAGKPQGAFGNYSGKPHLDHVHISFGEGGAQGATSFFTDVINRPPPTPTPTTSTWTECGWLHVGQMIGTDRPLPSCDGRFFLAQQGDGNLVLYRAADGAPLWYTGTYGTLGNQTIMQGDGNLVLYTSSGNPLFNTGTYGWNGAELAMQTDGNVVLYWGSKAIWNTGTYQ